MALADGKKTWIHWSVCVALLAFAFSMRMQTVIAILIGTCLIGAYFITNLFIIKKGSLIKKKYVSKRLSLIILASILLGVLAEIALRYQSANEAEIVRSQRAQLYNGIFEPFSEPNHCGGWTQPNWDLAMEERHVPLLQLLKKYLPRNPPSFYFEAARCKYKRLLKSEVYVWWVPRINYRDWQSGSILQSYDLLKDFVVESNKMLKLCLMTLLSYLVYARRDHFSPATVFVNGILIGLFILIGILELNGRYSFLLIGYFLIYCILKYEKPCDLKI
jgi:hypothetical protein